MATDRATAIHARPDFHAFLGFFLALMAALRTPERPRTTDELLRIAPHRGELAEDMIFFVGAPCHLINSAARNTISDFCSHFFLAPLGRSLHLRSRRPFCW